MVLIDYLKFEDLQGLKALYEKGFGTPAADYNLMLDTYDTIKDNPSYKILCAKIDGKIVGSVMGIICYELFGKCLPFMVIENVVVLDEFRGQGIAKQLMIKLEECAIQQKCTMILFVSSAHRIGAHKLYESLGYGVDKVNGYRKRLNFY